MQAEVYYAGEPVGTLEWTPDAYGVQVHLDCACPDSSGALLRCFAAGGAQTLRVGLPEPVDGRLRLTRHLSRETLRAAGYVQAVPTRFYLAVRPEEAKLEPPAAERASVPPAAGPAVPADDPSPAPRTGDAVLDALLDSGAVQAASDGDTLVLRCACAPDRPFALAPAFVLCTVENGLATLRWTKKDAAAGAASDCRGEN